MKRSFRIIVLSVLVSSCGTGGIREPADPLAPGKGDAFVGDESEPEKITIVDAAPDTFASLEALRDWLKSDAHMHDATDVSGPGRTPEESHNVCIKDVYIFGATKEDDNDYHIILGSSDALDADQLFFTAEISGLPGTASPFYQRLSAARENFKTHFGEAADEKIVFVAGKEHPPVPLKHITGSLFFDDDHYGGGYRIGDFRTRSAWEIHPVTEIGL